MTHPPIQIVLDLNLKLNEIIRKLWSNLYFWCTPNLIEGDKWQVFVYLVKFLFLNALVFSLDSDGVGEQAFPFAARISNIWFEWVNNSAHIQYWS